MNRVNKINDATLNMVKHFEGLNLHVYADIAGRKTIGYGHLILPNENYSTLTLDQANDLLMNDLEEAQHYVRSFIKIDINDNQFGALVDFTFNLGGHALEYSALIKLVNIGNHLEAPDEFIKWKNAAGKPNKGLLLRRLAEATLYLS